MNINELHVQIKVVLDEWDSQTAGLQEDLQPWMNIQGFTKSQVRSEIQEVVGLIERIQTSGVAIYGVAEYSINAWILVNVNALPGHIQNVPSNPASYVSAVLNVLYAIKQAIFTLYPNIFFVPEEIDKKIGNIQKCENELREGIALSSELRNLSLQAKQNAVSVQTHYESTNKLTQSIADAHQTVIANYEMIKEASSTAEAMRGNAEKMQKDAEVIELMATTCQKHADEIDNTLAAARRSGLAKAFSERAVQVRNTADFWKWAFFISLGLLAMLGVIFVGPYLIDPKLEPNWRRVLFELPLTAPFIWMAWYSASKYSGYSRVCEDYEFKASSALSLEGYKREALELDSNLARELLEMSLRNFGENPIRLYEKRQDPASPLQAALETGGGIVERIGTRRKVKVDDDAANAA